MMGRYHCTDAIDLMVSPPNTQQPTVLCMSCREKLGAEIHRRSGPEAYGMANIHDTNGRRRHHCCIRLRPDISLGIRRWIRSEPIPQKRPRVGTTGLSQHAHHVPVKPNRVQYTVSYMKGHFPQVDTHLIFRFSGFPSSARSQYNQQS